MSTTPALRFLREKNVAFEAREYEHREKGAEYAAEALSWPLEAMAKTLVVNVGEKAFVLAVMPGHLELSLRNLARVAGAKTARMATQEEAEKQTGYLVGGISPFGVRKPMRVFLEESLMSHPRIGINGGRRGLIVFLAPAAVRDLLSGTVAELRA